MILFFELIILTTAWCLGIKILTARGMILEKLGDYAEDKVIHGKLIFDPLVHCEWCLPSIHTIFGYAFALVIGIIHTFSWRLVAIYPLVAMGASFATGMSWAIYKTVHAICETYQARADGLGHEMEDIMAEQENYYAKHKN